MKVYVLLVNYLHGGDTSSVDVLGVYAKRKDAISKLMDMESSTIHTYKNVLELTDDQFKSSYGVSQGYEIPSWGELAEVDSLITDEEVQEEYATTEFVTDDFWS